MRLYKRVCPLVCWSVCRSVCWAVCYASFDIAQMTHWVAHPGLLWEDLSCPYFSVYIHVSVHVSVTPSRMTKQVAQYGGSSRSFLKHNVATLSHRSRLAQVLTVNILEVLFRWSSHLYKRSSLYIGWLVDWLVRQENVFDRKIQGSLTLKWAPTNKKFINHSFMITLICETKHL